MLERLPGQAAVAALWQHLLREDHLLAARFMVPSPVLATSYPRLKGAGGPLTVVEHGPDDFVAVCEETGARVPLSRQDLVVYRIDPRRLGEATAEVFDFAADWSVPADVSNTYNVGKYRPVAGFDFPAVLTIQIDRGEYLHAVESIVARLAGPFLLLAPTNHFHRTTAEDLLAKRDAAFIPLADAVGLDAKGGWELTDLGSQLLNVFRSRVLPSSESESVPLFPTPPQATWADLRMRFLDGHTVSVQVGGVSVTLSYQEMGMRDRRSQKPTLQWELLREFASGRGRLALSRKGVERLNQKRRENLARDLKAFFRIPGEPILVTSDKRAWRTVFALSDA